MTSLVRVLICLIAGLSIDPAGAKEKLTVLTAYPEHVVSHYETAFERDNPDIDLVVLWRMPHDALLYLRKPGQGGVDVYWSVAHRKSAAHHNFLMLKQENAWQKLAIDRSGLADRLGALPLTDPDGYYRVTEMAGYGFAVNPGYLQKHGLPFPKTWQDLSDARYNGHLAMPIPAKVGFAPMMVDSILRQYGWKQGWALLAGMVANARLVEPGAAFISELIGSGERGIAPSIDFFIASAAANGAPIQMIYPAPIAYSPAHIAITAASRHADAARRFVSFVLSDAGQKLLFHPDIGKLPVRPAVYADKPEQYFDPFAAAKRHPPVFDPGVSLPRLALNSALFDLMFTEQHETVQRLWRQLRAQEAIAETDKGEALAEIRRLLTALPVDASMSDDAGLQQIFMKRVEDPDADRQARELEQAWRLEIESRYKEAERLLRQQES